MVIVIVVVLVIVLVIVPWQCCHPAIAADEPLGPKKKAELTGVLSQEERYTHICTSMCICMQTKMHASACTHAHIPMQLHAVMHVKHAYACVHAHTAPAACMQRGDTSAQACASAYKLKCMRPHARMHTYPCSCTQSCMRSMLMHACMHTRLPRLACSEVTDHGTACV